LIVTLITKNDDLAESYRSLSFCLFFMLLLLCNFTQSNKLSKINKFVQFRSLIILHLDASLVLHFCNCHCGKFLTTNKKAIHFL
jgi:hypothetical protein